GLILPALLDDLLPVAQRDFSVRPASHRSQVGLHRDQVVADPGDFLDTVFPGHSIPTFNAVERGDALLTCLHDNPGRTSEYRPSLWHRSPVGHLLLSAIHLFFDAAAFRLQRCPLQPPQPMLGLLKIGGYEGRLTYFRGPLHRFIEQPRIMSFQGQPAPPYANRG